MLDSADTLNSSRRKFSSIFGIGSIGAALLATQTSSAMGGGAQSNDLTDTRTVSPSSEGAAIFINVQDFGARGDGVTDDQAAIQRAIDSAGSRGGHIVFPPGTYVIGFPIFIQSRIESTASILITGSGPNCVIQAGSGYPDNVALVYALGGGILLQDIGLDGANRAQNGVEYAYPPPSRPDDATIHINRVSFSLFLSHGFHCVGGEGYQIRDCFFNTLGGYAVCSRNNGINSFVDGNYMLGCGGVYLGATDAQPEGVRITNNTILCSGGAGIGVFVDKGLEIIISNNVIDQVKTSSVVIRNNSSYVKCIGNWLSCKTGGIIMSINDNSNSVTILGNTFEGGEFQLSVASAFPGMIHDITVSNNIFNNALNTAIFMNNVQRASISSNSCRKSGEESFFWGDGRFGVSIGNIFWKAPNVGAGLSESMNTGW
ncbi:glycosyl hydrolase family 28-related protein [Stenotrophomonas sp. BIGb0135]|uniref:glycosyl hydrolase family 28-related protein n=1 Tax=Stenotrophomonas sp. BIGb0135 TaxID=2940620 RepID=UPI002167E5A1|nr:glycosyl hydrolase family 28-related protein [Stenotrophomonas sp. BIGb0135]MCS4233717.1 hypothetical protein [Stenotrophomonas sp. BIGb0135]